MATALPRPRATLALRTHPPLGHALWVPAAAIVGFAAAVFSGALEMPRAWFLAVYVPVALAFLAAYARWSDLDLRDLIRRRWDWGLAGGAVVGAFLVWSILRDDASPRPEGFRLAFDLLWLGVVYGLVDALL